MSTAPTPDRIARSETTSDFDDQLNRTTVHDSGLYDPADTEDRIVLMYETVAAAETARRKVVAAGVPEAQARIHTHSPDGMDVGAQYEEPGHGVWHALKALFSQETHVRGYAEGMRRGYAMLVVHPPAGHRLEAVRVLEATGPVNFDARLEEWRSAGWDNMAAHEAAPLSGGSATVYDTATHTSHVEPVGGPAAGGPLPGSHPVDYPTIGNITGKPVPPLA